MTRDEVIASIKGLEVNIKVLRGSVPAVRGLDLEILKGEILGLVGESGCGKTTAMLALARLLPRNAEVRAESICINGVELREPSREQLLKMRGSILSYIFQDPQASLNPVMRIGEQIAETILVQHPGRSADEVSQECLRLLDAVQISDPESWLNAYPHQLSGGMKQRVMTAIALANAPAVLIADEPTTSLDVTVQSEILRLLKDINKRLNMSVVFITHDLSVAHKLCDRIAVMYTGRIVEIGPADEIARHPRHPYTRNLWGSIPRLDQDIRELTVIPGSIPDKLALPAGCTFHPRCERAQDICRTTEPPSVTEKKGSFTCFFPYKD